jgi:alpha-L-fucosidase
MKTTFRLSSPGLFFPIWLVAWLSFANAQDQAPGAESPAQRAARLAWWRDGRSGMFIHWGPVSLKGTEISWSRANSNAACPNKGEIPVAVYDNLYRQFNPTNFTATRWAGIAKAAGMRYLVLTAKHCDGFLLWHSKASDYNISASPFRRDICEELARAARQSGLRIGWYFSPMDWRDPDFRTERNRRFLGRMQAEVRELLSNYGTIDLLWFDWDGNEAVYDQPAMYRLVRQLQPKIIINNRLDLGKGSSDRKLMNADADYYTPEQQIGQYDDRTPWETCMTLGTQWAWKPNDKIKSARECIGILARCAGGDGNLLLNVGPMPSGEIEPRQVEVLEGIGAWLRKYGQSIYGTRGGPFKPGRYGASTRKGKIIYLHLLDTTTRSIKLPPLAGVKILKCSVLTGGKAAVTQAAEGLDLAVTVGEGQPMETIVKLELDSDTSKLVAIAVKDSP